MPIPGVNVTFGDAASASGAPTDTGQWFIAGTSDRGPAGTAVKIQSLSSFVTNYGDRQSYSVLYDCVETYLREYGSVVYVSRMVGPAPVLASHAFVGAASAPSFTAKAKSYGTWGNSLKVAVLAGTVFQLQVSTVADGILETSPQLADVAAAVAWSAFSTYITVTADGPAAPTPIAATLLTSGTDDRASITNTQKIASLTAFGKTLGPGQVSMPGESASALNAAVMAHAAANNRVAVLDVSSSTVLGDMTTISLAARTDGNGDFGATFGPWPIIPGLVPLTTRQVPQSAVIAGKCALNDRYFDAGQAVAGHEYPYQYVVSFTEYTDAEHETALLAGLNLSKNMYGSLQNYGFRSVVDPAGAQVSWLQFNYARLRMAITARLQAQAENFVFSKLDGAGHTRLAFKDALSGVLTDFHAKGSLYGATAAEAFSVDVGDAVNTPTTLANGELHARVMVRFSPHAEAVYIDIAKTPITQSV